MEVDLDCPHLSLARFWDDDDSRGIVLVELIESLRLRRGGAWEEVSESSALWEFERQHRRLSREIRSFAFDIGLASPYSTTSGDWDLVELIRANIGRGALIGLRRGRAKAAATQPILEQRHLVRDLEAHGRLNEGGRLYTLVAGTDVDGIAERNSFEVVQHDEAVRVLDAIAKLTATRPEVATLLAKARAMLSRDWRAPLEPDGLVLLRKTVVPRMTASHDGPAITPSQIRAMVEAQDASEEPTIRLVNVEAQCFVPGQETNTIAYAIDGPVAKTASVVMKVKSVPAKGEATVIDTIIDPIQIPEPYSATGKLDWDGKISGPAGVITLKGSPYEVTFELTSKSGKTSTSNPGKIQIEVQEIQLVVDDSDQRGEADPFDATSGDTAQRPVQGLIAELKKSGMPGDCEGRLVIDSPIFKLDNSEMVGSQSFLEYQKAVGNGPAVPLRALVKLKSKAGGGKRAPAVLADTRILWDFKLDMIPDLDRSLTARGVQAQARTFLKRVAGHQEALTRPKGVSVHFKLGGSRAKPDDRSAAGRQWQDADEWAMPAPDKRTWAAFTVCDGESEAATDARVTFFPGRMAGDVHKIRAVVDVDESLDVEDEAVPDTAPAARRSNAIKIATWRRVPVVGNWIVGTHTTPVDIPPLAAEYGKAAMVIEAASPAPPQDVAATWQDAYAGVVDGYVKASTEFYKDALERTGEGYPVRYRDFIDYWERVNKDAGFFGKLWQRIINFFGAGDEPAYKRRCDDKALDIVALVARRLTIPPGGLTALKFGKTGPHNQIPGSSYTAGWAPYLRGLNARNKAIFFQFTIGSDTRTFIHEVGHTLFLAHAPGHFTAGQQPGGFQANAHDKDQICLMSYHPDKKYLCGLCLLKLAGVSYQKIRNDGTVED
jgi:hypothetical protein